MTVIVADGRHGVMAADSMLSDGMGGHAQCGKIIQARGVIAGAAGHGGACVRFLKWIARGGRAPDFRDFEVFDGIVLEPGGLIRYYEHGCDYDLIAAPYYAIGIGAQAATAAMKADADAVRAVEIACEVNIYCGPPVQVLKFPQPKRKSRAPRKS